MEYRVPSSSLTTAPMPASDWEFQRQPKDFADKFDAVAKTHSTLEVIGGVTG